MVILQEFEKSRILHALSYMESEGEKVKDLQTSFSIVISHCIEKGFFISNDIVVYQMIVHSLLWNFFYDPLKMKMFASW
jgi:hypothetical protein